MVIKEKSCGIIPVKFRKGTPVYLLIQHNVGHWGLPKGHKNPGETDKETAKRELAEETGLELRKIFKTPFVEKYLYRRSGKTFSKKVVYYIGLVKPGKVKMQKEEIKSYAWLNLKAAIHKLNYPEMRGIISQASKMVSPPSARRTKLPKAE